MGISDEHWKTKGRIPEDGRGEGIDLTDLTAVDGFFPLGKGGVKESTML